jgi:hypothetical protein
VRRYLEVLAQATDLPDRDDAWGRQATEELRGAQFELLALLYAVRQQCYLNRFVVDHDAMDRVSTDLQNRNAIDPDEDLEALVPTARAIQSILAGPSPCGCLHHVTHAVSDRMEAIRNLAPRAQGN